MTHVVALDQPYFKGSPAQATPPDGTLKKGTKVLLFSFSGSYSKVMTEDGLTAYTSTDCAGADLEEVAVMLAWRRGRALTYRVRLVCDAASGGLGRGTAFQGEFPRPRPRRAGPCGGSD